MTSILNPSRRKLIGLIYTLVEGLKDEMTLDPLWGHSLEEGGKCMLQLGSRQGMRCPTRVWWAIMQVRLDSQLQTHEIVPILAHAQQHYWELNIFVACWTTRVKTRYEIHPTRVWCVIMQVRRVCYCTCVRIVWC